MSKYSISGNFYKQDKIIEHMTDNPTKKSSINWAPIDIVANKFLR
jgi:hypothetical protein